MEIREMKVYPKAKALLGTLEYAGRGADIKGVKNDGKRGVVYYSYNLYSDKHSGDVSVRIPITAGLKSFSEDSTVELVNPHITAEARKINDNVAYSDYILWADDLVLV